MTLHQNLYQRFALAIVICIIVPALMLVTVSYEWSFHESTPSEDDFVVTGYWIQLAMHILTFEVLDCAAIADAVFMISMVLVGRFLIAFAMRIGFDRKYKMLFNVLR